MLGRSCSRGTRADNQNIAFSLLYFVDRKHELMICHVHLPRLLSSSVGACRLTLGVRRRWKPQRRRSGGWKRSPARLCWVAGDRRGRPVFPRTDRRHPRVHRPGDLARRRLTRRPPQGTTRAAPPGPARPPGSVRPPGVDRALLGHRTERVSDRDRLPQTTTPTHARTRRPSSGTGRRATRPPRARAPGDGDTTLTLGGGWAPARARTRHQPHRCQSRWRPRRPGTPEHAHAPPASGHRIIGRHGGPPDRRLGPRLLWGLGRAGVAAMTTGTPCVWPGAVLLGLLFLWATPGNKAAHSNPTLGVRRRQWPKRRRSVGYWRSPASPG